MKCIRKKIIEPLLIFSWVWLFAINAMAQIRSGAAFLNMLPGARQHAMGSNLSGALDDLQSFYSNPGALGFYREYHFSGSYSDWFADIYHLSLNAGRRVPTFLSQKTQFALGIRYLGVKEFDSTLKNRPPAAASDLVFSLSAGLPLSFVSKNVSLGFSLKYLQSELHTYRAVSRNIDAGILWRSPRIALRTSIFEYAHFSLGASICNLGNSLVFQNQATPLPETFRAGAGVSIGSHRGLQFQILANYQKTKNEPGFFSLGSELGLAYDFAIQAGYNFDEHFLSKFSMGMSFRLHDHQAFSKKFTGRDAGLRVDLAASEKNELFSESYRGNISLYPLRPEPFRLISPAQNDTFEVNEVTFAWEKSNDPDLYDWVSYIFLLEREHEDKSQLPELYRWQLHGRFSPEKLIELITADNSPHLIVDTLSYADEQSSPLATQISHLKAGNYWWTVLAMDRDGHLTVSQPKLRRFYILFPDIKIKHLKFEPSPWISLSDTQGVISVAIENIGKLPAENIYLTTITQSITGDTDTLLATEIAKLAPGDSAEIKVNWLTPHSGKFLFKAEAFILRNKNEVGIESNLVNNTYYAEFYTIPKGRISIPDTVNAYLLPHLDHNLPLLPRIFFPANSYLVPEPYYMPDENWLYPPLRIIAERLKNRHDLYISLEGFVDHADGEPVDLAKKRVMAVKNLLLQFGVDEAQMPDSSIKWVGNKYKRPTRNLDVREERRFVKISAFNVDTHESDITLFSPIPFKTFEQPPVPLPIRWSSTVRSPLPVEDGFIEINSQKARSTIDYLADNDTIIWIHSLDGETLWLNQNIQFNAEIKDSLGRKFKTRVQQTYLNGIELHLPKVVGLADFNNRNPYPIYPWDELFAKLKLYLKWMHQDHIRFIGHACGIPPNTVNNIFSKIRAKNFQQHFLDELEKRRESDTELYNLIHERLAINELIGEGANDPFSYSIDTLKFLNSRQYFDAACYDHILKIKNKKITKVKLQPFILEIKNGQITLTGDNETPEGRQLNRRIELQLFVPGLKKQLAMIRNE